MKKSITVILLLLAAGSAAALDTQPCAVYLILDTSWSCDHSLQDLRSLARQSAMSLLPGDHIEVLAAQTGQPRIRLAQHIKTASTPEFKEITRALNTVNSGFLRDASISKAIEFVLNRIKQTRDNHLAPQVIFVFTDGRLNDRDARRLDRLYPILVQHQVLLYMTGDKSTSRKILIAANQGKLTYFLLSEANPAQWLGEKRVYPEDPQPLAGVKDNLPITPTRQTASTSPTDMPPEQHAPAQVKSPEPASEKEPDTREPDLARESQQAPLTRRIPVPSPGVQPPALPATPSQGSDSVEPEPLAPRKGKLTGSPGVGWRWLIAFLILLGAIITVLLLVKYRQARIWASKIKSPSTKYPEQRAERLMVRIGDRTQHLGRLRQLGKLYIGSGPRSAIRIHDKSVADRHLKLQRRGEALWLTNLSSRPTAVNNIPLPPGKSSRLSLPAVVTLSDAVTIKLELQKPPSLAAPRKEQDPHGPETN